MCSGKKPRDNVRIKHNLEWWKKLTEFSSIVIHFADLTAVEIDANEAHGAFVAASIVCGDPSEEDKGLPPTVTIRS